MLLTKETKKSNTNIDDESGRERDAKRLHMTSNALKRPQMTSGDSDVKPVKSKNKLGGGANIEINANNLDEMLHDNNL